MTLPRFAVVLLVVAAPLAAFGCNKGSGDGASPAPSASAANGDAEAKTIFEQRCTPCHGASGRGDGAAASALTTKPRDYTNADWQKTVTDDDLKKVIVKGGKAVGKSELMPPNPDLESKGRRRRRAREDRARLRRQGRPGPLRFGERVCERGAERFGERVCQRFGKRVRERVCERVRQAVGERVGRGERAEEVAKRSGDRSLPLGPPRRALGVAVPAEGARRHRAREHEQRGAGVARPELRVGRR